MGKVDVFRMIIEPLYRHTEHKQELEKFGDDSAHLRLVISDALFDKLLDFISYEELQRTEKDRREKGIRGESRQERDYRHAKNETLYILIVDGHVYLTNTQVEKYIKQLIDSMSKAKNPDELAGENELIVTKGDITKQWPIVLKITEQLNLEQIKELCQCLEQHTATPDFLIEFVTRWIEVGTPATETIKFLKKELSLVLRTNKREQQGQRTRAYDLDEKLSSMEKPVPLPLIKDGKPLKKPPRRIT